MVNDITISKGSYSVTIYALEVNDNYTNKIFVITPAQGKSNQADGSKNAKIVDLLRVTHEIVIRGYITGTDSKTAKTVKQDLVNIWKGAATAGGTVSLTYDYNAKAFGNTSATNTNPITGYIEKVNFKDVAMDEPSDLQSNPSNYTDVAKFEVSITFIEGTSI